MPATIPTSTQMPDWAQSLSEKYYSRTLSVFVLYGNVRDLVPLNRDGTTEYVPLLTFLHQGLFGRRNLVMTYDRGGGLSFAHPDMQSDFRSALSGYDSFHQTNYSQDLPRNPDGVLNLLDNYLRLRIGGWQKDRSDPRFRRDYRARRRCFRACQRRTATRSSF